MPGESSSSDIQFSNDVTIAAIPIKIPPKIDRPEGTPDNADTSVVEYEATLIDAAPPPPGARAMTGPAAASRLSSLFVSAAVLSPGDVLGDRYEILQLLGEGGMGAVYKARDRELDRFVALKVIRPELASSPAILARFKQELLLAHQVTHKNVIRIYDLAESGGVKFMTMEFIEGVDLRCLLLERGKFPPLEAAKVIRQVCLALDATHSVGVVHRDLKPQNIMQDKQGRILVMDFGLARSVESEGMTQTGALVGTMEYMSPEQALGEELDQRSDLFALGLIFFELLTGKMPYKSETALASLLKRSRERAIPAADLDPNVPRGLSDIVSKCLERDLTQRYASVQEILKDLDAWEGKRRVSASKPLLNRLHNLPWKHSAAAVVVFLIAAATTWYISRRTRPGGPVQHAPISVLVADFQNHTTDTLFDDTLEPMLNLALEGASFINGFSRGDARKLAQELPQPTDKLDEQAARLVAVSQGVGAVVTGELNRRGDHYSISAKALDARKGSVIATAEVTARDKDEILFAIPKLAAPLRKALGDTTPESVQLQAAGGAFTAASVEVVHDYGRGMEQQFAGNMQGALQSFSKAAKLDPNFARAYAGMAAASRNLGNGQDAEKYVKLAMAHVDRMTERERYRIRGLYYVTTGDFPKCVEEYTSLIKLYPADNLAHNNLAKCYGELHNYSKAIEESQQALKITPNSGFYRMNLSVFSTYTGDFQTAEKQARAVLQSNPSYETAYVALAYAQLGQGQIAQGAETYQRVGKLSPFGASMSAAGLADLALYEGRLSDAVRLLESGAASDMTAKISGAQEKLAMLAYTHFRSGHKGLAVEAAKRALLDTHKVNVRFLVARVLVEAQETQRALALAAALASELSVEAQADAKLIEGEVALQKKDVRRAIQLFTEANQVLDTWMGWFDLGQAYLAAGLYVQADSEFDRCMKGRGQAMDLLDGPTYGYFPPVYYYQGLVREGLNSPGARDSYRNYMSIRGKAGEDPLLLDIRRHLQ